MKDWKTPFEYGGPRKFAFGLICVYVVCAIGLSIAQTLKTGVTGLAPMVVVQCGVLAVLLLSDRGRREFLFIGIGFMIITISMIVASVEYVSAS